MDDGEIDFSSQGIFSNTGFADNLLATDGCSLGDSAFEEFFSDTHACTHTHTCNPPGPDHTHTHTCFHVHTKIVPAPEEEEKATTNTDDTGESVEKPSVRTKKRSLGNREAVRKYREKKKAHAASLEREVFQLRARVQHLTVLLQGKASVEAENARLRSLLVDIRWRIDGEIANFPCQKAQNDRDGVPLGSSGGHVLNPCNLPCVDDGLCLMPVFTEKPGRCAMQEIENVGSEQGVPVCDLGLESKEFYGCSHKNLAPPVSAAGISTKKKKGAHIPCLEG